MKSNSPIIPITSHNYYAHYSTDLASLSPYQLFLRLISSRPISFHSFLSRLTPRQHTTPPKYSASYHPRLVSTFSQLHLLPLSFIEFVAITGSTASGSPQTCDDIDLLIITKPHRLWLCRLLVFVTFKLHRIPIRSFTSSRPLSLCFNLWLDSRSLSIPPSRRHLRTASDLALLRPLFSTSDSHYRLLYQNRWAQKFVAPAYSHLLGSHFRPTSPTSSSNFILDGLNLFCFCLQYMFMLPKITTQTVSLSQAFFPPR